MPNKLTTFILAVTLCFSVICSSTASAGLLDGTSWSGTKIQHYMAFYEDHMYVRGTSRSTWAQSILPYLSFYNLDGSITYINYFPEFLIPTLMWGRCDTEEGEASYNAIGLLFYVLPLCEHIKPYALLRTNWAPPKTAMVIDSFNAPGWSPEGLAFDGEYLWNADNYWTVIYKIDTSGNVIDSFDTPGSFPRGLTFDGTYLWLSDSGGRDSQGKIYKLNTSGNVIDSFDSPGPAPDGLAWDGEYLWNADTNESKIYKIDTSGNVIDSFDAPGGSPGDLAFDGTYLWGLSGYTLLIYKLDISGNVIDSFYSPATFDPYNIFDFPTGLAWDSEYLWVTYDERYEETIYKLDVSQ